MDRDQKRMIMSGEIIREQCELKEFADDNLIFDENGSEFSKKVEKNVEKEKLLVISNFSFFPQCFQKTCTADNVGKGEIARYEQFLLFPTMFSKDLYCRHIKTRACLGKG